MRCPKCGYISFDHLTACGKCSASLEKTLAQIEGTTTRAEPPYFLGKLMGGGGVAHSEAAEESFAGAHEESDSLIELGVSDLVPPHEEAEDEVISLDEAEITLDEVEERSPMDALVEDDASDEDVVDLSAFMGEVGADEDAPAADSDLDLSLDEFSLSLEEDDREEADGDNQFDFELDDDSSAGKK